MASTPMNPQTRPSGRVGDIVAMFQIVISRPLANHGGR